MKTLILLALLFILVFTGILADSCSSRRSEPLRGALVLNNAQEKNGYVLYMKHCQKCHPLGEAGLGPAINSNPAPPFVKRFQMRHGLGVMPSFKANELSSKELHDISQYIRALKRNKK